MPELFQPVPNRSPVRRKGFRISWGFLLIGLLLLFAGGYLGFRVFLKNYLHSDAFLAQINRATSRALKVSGGFEPIHWQDSQASSPLFSATGETGAPIRAINARGIEAQLNFRSIWDGIWEITELSVDEANIDLGEHAANPTIQRLPARETAPAQPASRNFLTSFLPKKTELKLVKIESANLTFPLPGDASSPGEIARAQRLRINARPLGEEFSDGHQLSGYGGEIYLPEGQRLSLLDFDTRWRDGTLFISNAVADLKDTVGARVQCSGRLDSTGRDSALKMHLSGIDIEEIVAADWKQRITGLVESDVTVRIQDGITTYNGDASLSGGVLNALPILDNLADFTKHDTFRRLPLNKATAKFTREGDTTHFSGILIESSGTMRVTGSLDVVDGNANGTLFVGVVPGVLRWIPGAEQKVFTRLDDGHLWAEMHVHGPLQALEEDLSPQLVTGAIVQTIEAVPERAIDAGGKVILQGTSILREGVRSGLDLIDGFVPFLGN
ncbi:MAG: hypothetical protein KDN22_24285 [Verrucomicrobiae bacterium]|nr:hypothetical protein [Verrucomicrobiae bacterium]